MSINMSNKSINSNIEEIGGLNFLMNNMGIYLPYIFITSLGTIVGILGTNLKILLIYS